MVGLLVIVALSVDRVLSFLEEPADLAGMLGGLVHQVLGPHGVDDRIRTVVLTGVILIERPNQTRTMGACSCA